MFAGKTGLRQRLCRSCLSTDVASLWLRMTERNDQKTLRSTRLIVCAIENDFWQRIISQAQEQPSSCGRRDVCDEMHGEGLSENQAVTPLSPYSEAFLLPNRENKESQGDRQAVHDGRCVPEM